MRLLAIAPLLTLLTLLLLMAPETAASRTAWRLPVVGPVVGMFRLGDDPYAPGQRRGVDLAARRGAVVRAPCSGRVGYSGRVPGFGGAVSIGCGELTATVLRLGSRAVRRGTDVRAGMPVGRADASGLIRLGARVTSRRLGYLDPLTLLAEAVPTGPVPGRRPPPSRRPPAGPAGPPQQPLTAPQRAPAPIQAPAPATPVAAWLGLALLATTLPAGGALAARGRRRRKPAARAGWEAAPE